MFKKIKKSKVKKKGFTLIEALVAVFIFALMMTAVSNIFAKIIRTHHDTRNVQENLESAQYAMNLMAKTLRTSSVDDSGAFPAPTSILIYNYSQGKCIEYAFDGVNHEVYFQEAVPAAFSSMADCLAAGPYSAPSVIAENVDGKFDYSASSNGVAMGKATISMTVSHGNDTVHIQSSVSLRDYNQALP